MNDRALLRTTNDLGFIHGQESQNGGQTVYLIIWLDGTPRVVEACLAQAQC